MSYNRSDYNTSNYESFIQAISELHRASNQTLFVSANTLKGISTATTNISTVDVGIINTTFQKLNYNENTPSNGGLNYSAGIFYPLANKPSFLNKKVVIASPLKNVISGASANFNFKSNLIFTNATQGIKTLVVDFGENIIATIINNSIISVPSKNVNYTSKGMKTLKFTITFSDNSVIITYGKIYFDYKPINQTVPAIVAEDLPCYEYLRDTGSFTSTISYQGAEETSPVFGQIEYTTFYHNNNGNNEKKIIKPIIIIDGFDPGDTRKVLDCNCAADPNCVTENDDNDNGVFNPILHRSIEDLMSYDDIDPATGGSLKRNLIKVLRGLGYDVIIINNSTYTTTNVAGNTVTIDGGADYIERNAMNIVSYIQYMKNKLTQNGSSEKLVLVGPSMGGQISRYALAYMDKKYAETANPIWIHNTRLWISVDSPHLGANIPLGTQADVYCLGYIQGDEKAKKKYNELLNATAAREQVINQFNVLENDTSFNSLFTTYYNNLNTNGVTGSGGYPITTPYFRKIALINGSLDGTKTNYGSSVAYERQTYLNVRGYIDLSFLFFNWTLTGFRNQCKFMPKQGEWEEIFYGTKFLDYGYSVSASTNSIKGSLDVLPGGFYDSHEKLKNEMLQSISDKNLRGELRDYFPIHSFIPAFSALGYLQPNQNWANPVNTNLKCPSNNLTPFDSYYGESSNSQHTSFTKESVAWLLAELAGNPQAPHFPIQDNILTGATSICANTNTTYTITDVCKVPSPVIYTQNGITTNGWSVSPNLNIVSSTPYSVTVSQISNGQGTITATFQNGQTVSKTIWVGAPGLNNFSFDSTPHSLCFSDANYYYTSPQLNFDDRIKANFSGLTPAEAISNSNWQWQTLNGIIMINGTRNIRQICPIAGGETSVSVRVQNTCGWSSWYEFPLEVIQNSSLLNKQANINIFKIYPNPSTDIVNIDLKDQKNQPEKNTTISGELFDMMGQSKSKVEINNNRATFSVKGLSKGIYVLKIYINDQVENHQIAIE